jgi:hypothetical protein
MSDDINSCLGREIQTVYFPNGETASTSNRRKLRIQRDCGDSIWIIDELDGIETARHNVAFIASIVWKETLCP